MPRCACILGQQVIQTGALSVSGGHFATERHTGDNILRFFKRITEEYGLVGFSTTVVTDTGSTWSPDCAIPPGLTAYVTAYTLYSPMPTRRLSNVPELKKYEDEFATL